MSVRIVEEIQCGIAVGFPEKFTACIIVGMLRAVDGLGSAKFIGIISNGLPID